MWQFLFKNINILRKEKVSLTPKLTVEEQVIELNKDIEKVRGGLISIKCGVCGRKYAVSNSLFRAINKGRAENVCGYCSSEHDDHDYPAERENESEEG